MQVQPVNDDGRGCVARLYSARQRLRLCTSRVYSVDVHAMAVDRDHDGRGLMTLASSIVLRVLTAPRLQLQASCKPFLD